MKCQNPYSRKNKKTINNLSTAAAAELIQRVERIKL